ASLDPTSRGRRYFSWASSTCSLPSRVRARRAKISRINCVRSTTLRSSRLFSSRSCAGDNSLSKITRSASASAAACASTSTLPLPRNVAGSGFGRSCSTRKTTRAPAASARPPSSSRECSASTRRAPPVTRPTSAARSTSTGRRVLIDISILAPSFVPIIAGPMRDVVLDFPRSLSSYPVIPGQPLFDILRSRIESDPINAVATLIFFLAVIHTFLASRFTEASHRAQARHDAALAAAGLPPRPSVAAEMLHFFGEVEAVFGLWAVPLLGAILFTQGWSTAAHYANNTVNYTE